VRYRRRGDFPLDALDEAVGVFPQGLSMATDLTIGVWSTATGTTAITGAGDVIQGFAIIGA